MTKKFETTDYSLLWIEMSPSGNTLVSDLLENLYRNNTEEKRNNLFLLLFC